jgi:hypothetical protein
MKISLFLVCISFLQFAALAQKKEPKIVIVTLDGFRWKELYRGADSSLLYNREYNPSKDSLARRKQYWAKTQNERREKLMPFFWQVIARRGQVYGNRDAGSLMNVKNRYWISYPGYNEMFTGYPDTIVNSNDFGYNPNVTVQEWANKQPGFKGKVATFASWFTFERIMNRQRCGFPVNAGFTTPEGKLNNNQRLLNEEQFLLPRMYAPSERYDGLTYLFAREYMKQRHPRILQLSFIETDASAHHGLYDAYLDAANHIDNMLKGLWETIQADPYYKDQTTLYVAVDHGRGDGVKWKNHSRSILGADQIWFAVMGPQTKTTDTRGQYYQNQHAQTIAKLLGLKFVSPHIIGEPLKLVTNK